MYKYLGKKTFDSNELVFNNKLIIGGQDVKIKTLSEVLANVGDKIRLEKNILELVSSIETMRINNDKELDAKELREYQRLKIKFGQ